MDEQDFDLDAAGLRADGAELASNVEVLASKLEDALPAQTTVKRRSTRMFGGEKVVAAIEVRMGDCRWTVAVDGHRLDAMRAQEVRGVVIKREPMDMGAWVAGLAAELRAEAQTSEQARGALTRLLGA